VNQKRKILVIAEAANPDWVSVPLVGWSLAAALREVANVHLVTQIRNRDAIAAAGLVEGRDFTAIDSEALARPMWKAAHLLRMGEGKGWTMIQAINSISYPYFEHLVWHRFGADIRAGRYDIVHRITPLSPTTVSPIAARCARAGVPFVLGPLNGGIPWPPGFDVERRREREWLSYVRGAYRFLPGRQRMFDATAAILVGSRHTESEIPARYRDRTVYVPENAVDPERFSRMANQDVSGRIRACFIGRLVPYKGPDMALEAAAPLLREGRLRFDIIGDGPMRQDLEARASALSVTEAVTFHGNLPHRQVQDVAVQANLLLFPSIREFGGGVVLEAMALGLVPLVVDYGGPGELVSEDVGFKVPIGSREEIISRVRERLQGIVSDPSPLSAMSIRGRALIAADFTWVAKAEQIAEVYKKVLRRGGLRPGPVSAVVTD
jgi:glycosyltransferase involved in cell wall biosynthesis